MGRLVGVAAGLTAGFVAAVWSFQPFGGVADETDPLKQAAIAKAPDFSGPLPLAEDPAPDKWTRTGNEGSDWAETAVPAAIGAMNLWGDLMALPLSVDDRVVRVSDPQQVAARHRALDEHFSEAGFAARLERALAGVATDETYLAYADYEIADVAVTYRWGEDGGPSCSPCLITRDAFVVFEGRPRHRNHDGTWSDGERQQFQVWLNTRTSPNPKTPDEWVVSKFYAIPVEGEGAAAFLPSVTPTPVS